MSTAPRIDELRKKFEENPRRYFAPLANELRKAGDLDQAIALCREHLPKQPGHMSGHIVFGQALFENGDFEEARGVFEQALALDPENLIALRHLGDIARRQGDAPAARRWYERVLEADPRNDDIAAQLATLSAYATPVPAAAPAAVTPPASAPTPVEPIDVPEFETTPDASGDAAPTAASAPVPATTTVATPLGTVAQELLSLSPLQAASELPPPPEEERVFFDLDAIEAAAADAVATEQAEAQAKQDPFFGRLADTPSADVIAAAEAEAEAAFEEGFVAAEWPDTTALAARAATPRSSTPPVVEVPAEVAEAFGRESGDAIPDTLPEPEMDVALPEEEELVLPVAAAEAAPSVSEAEPAVVEEASSTPSSVADLGIQVGTSILDFEEPEALASTEPTDLPWLAEPVTPSEEVEEIVEAFAEDARAKGEADDVAVVAMPEPHAIGSNDQHESSFADVLEESLESVSTSETDIARLDGGDPEAAEPETAAAELSEVAGGAFVTETMGELLVSQGFLDRAIAVYEELVRRRPADPVPLGRLAELRAQQARIAAASTSTAEPVLEAAPEEAPENAPEPVVRTAQQWFAALAARRVERRTPVSTTAVPTPRAMTPLSAPVVPSAPVRITPVGAIPAEDSLASLFGTEGARADATAAEHFATAFSGAAVEGARENLFASGAMAAVREPTPIAPVAAQPESTGAAGAGFSFDRFFPDPATAAPAASPSVISAAPTSAAPGTPTSSPAAESKAADDLAQFSAWLKGLGNP
jgi:tetratricopeptide (TPR) repeat protein